MRAKIKITGVPELRKALRDARGLNAVKMVVKKYGAEVQQGAQRRVPVDTGHLKRSIFQSISSDGLQHTTRAEADYSAYVEYGTRKMSAQPYLGPALRAVEPRFIQELRRIIR